MTSKGSTSRLPHLCIDKKQHLCYYVCMIKSITNKYYEYNPNEFLPIYRDGKIDNKKEFHIYKLKKAALAADRAWMSFVERAHQA